MDTETLKKLYGMTHRVLKMNCEGFTHEESLIRSPAGESSLNWIVGHILSSRMRVIAALGQQPFMSKEETALYERGTKLDELDAPLLDFAKLLADFDRSQEMIDAGLTAATPELFAGQADFGTVDWTVAFFYFHEAYHTGQTGIARKLAGKGGAL